MAPTKEEDKERKKPIVNFRLFLFLALGVIFGVFVFGSVRFGRLRAAYFIVFALLFAVALFPISLKRTAALFLCLLIGAGLGTLSLFLFDRAYSSKEVALSSYDLCGTVVSVSEKSGYSVLLLKNVTIEEEEYKGKCKLTVRDTDYLPGDEIQAQASVESADLENFFEDGYVRELYAKNIRYLASADSAEKVGKSSDPFLLLNAALFNRLDSCMEAEEASISYALLTGNSSSMDEEMMGSIRRGGIAHIFAISGLHIGILFSFVMIVCRKLGPYRILPAVLLSALYCAFCAFTVSSVRALIMCAVFSLISLLGRKRDFIEGLSFSAIIVLLLMPAQWYSAGFRLSFGACAGLALFEGSFRRFFVKIRIPKYLAAYLSANLAVEIFLFPVQMDCFGYFSVLGILMNFIFAPIVPILFLGLLLFSLLAVIIPAAAPFFLALPEGAMSLFIFTLAKVNPRFVLSGFALGAGSTVFLLGCVFLSERVRMRFSLRSAAAATFTVLFSLCLVFENVVFSGFTAEYFVHGESSAALIRTREHSVLFINEESTPSQIADIVLREKNSFDVVVTFGEGIEAINVAAFLDTDLILAPDERECALEREVVFAQEYELGDIKVRYLNQDRAVVFLQGKMIEVSLMDFPLSSPDIFLGSGFRSICYECKNSVIREKAK